MKNEEAMEIITSLKDHDWVYRKDAEEAHRMACEALEKQIPRRPYAYGEINRPVCPKCERALFLDQEFCNYCGQAIDWGDEDDKR